MLAAYCAYQRAVGNWWLAEFIEAQGPAVHKWRATHATKQADMPAGTEPGLE